MDQPTAEQAAPQSVQANPEDSILGAESQQTEQQQQQPPVAEEATARPSYGEFKLPEGVAVDAESLKPAAELFAAAIMIAESVSLSVIRRCPSTSMG